MVRARQPEPREGQAGPGRVADGLVLPQMPGNAGGGKEPWFESSTEKGARRDHCQSASKIDPLSACNIDPLSGTAEVVSVVNRGDPSGFV